MDKTKLLQAIIGRLKLDLEVLFTAAKAAHAAATHEENIPDNRYDTLALEASYVAQGQANRALELRRSIEMYKQLMPLRAGDAFVQLTSLVTLEDGDGTTTLLFIGPTEGGLKIAVQGKDVVVITPGSPMGKELLGRVVGDSVDIEAGSSRREYEIAEVC